MSKTEWDVARINLTQRRVHDYYPPTPAARWDRIILVVSVGIVAGLILIGAIEAVLGYPIIGGGAR